MPCFHPPGTFIDHPPIPRAASKPQKALTQRVPSAEEVISSLVPHGFQNWLVVPYPSEKYYILSWNYPSQYMEK